VKFGNKKEMAGIHSSDDEKQSPDEDNNKQGGRAPLSEAEGKKNE